MYMMTDSIYAQIGTLSFRSSESSQEKDLCARRSQCQVAAVWLDKEVWLICSQLAGYAGEALDNKYL